MTVRAGAVLVTGGAGLLGGWVVRTAPAGIEVHLTVRRRPPAPEVGDRVAAVHRVELADADAVAALVASVAPEAVVHTAYTPGSRADIVEASAAVADACRATGAALVHVSTEAVFSGQDPPYAEDRSPDPVNDYGRWKAEAEREVLGRVPDACVVRPSLVTSLRPPDDATAWLLDSVRAGTPVTLFHDEIRQPIRAEDLARELWALLALPRVERAGVWHLPGPEVLSRVELGRRILDSAGLDAGSVREGSAAEHPTPRPRDLTMVAVRRRVLGVPLSPAP